MSNSPIYNDFLADATLKPLTKLRTNGETLNRPEEVEMQISALLRIERSKFVQNLGITDKTSPQFIKDESLVYFFRETDSTHIETLDAIAQTLMTRCHSLVYSNVRRFAAKECIDDCVDEIIGELFAELCDRDSNKNDFAQARFGLFLKWFCNKFTRKYGRRRDNSNTTYSIDEKDEEGNLKIELVAQIRDYSAIDFQDVKKGLHVLPEPLRTLFILRYAEDWKIESQNPDEMTLSKRFGKTGRTIRTWLERAEILLAEWRENRR